MALEPPLVYCSRHKTYSLNRITSSRIRMHARTLIFIVAYNAEEHLESVFKRIPYARLPAGCEILVIDDASPDATFEVGKRAALTCPIPVRVLKNPKNLGYGGNQKLGYQIAIAEGFAAVALLHGDGQYAPELLPEIFAPILIEGADVVLGSRMLRKKDALAGGMPFYKWVGNQILTKIENRILGAKLSEFHTGYRAYRVETLRNIPFRYNTNDFHFDTDILIQLLRKNARFCEIPIPTFYGNEVCHVNGWRYFFDCLRSCWHDWLTKKGIFYRRKFDLTPSSERYQSKIDVRASSHQILVQMIPTGSRVLQVGQQNPWIPNYLTTERGCDVTILNFNGDADYSSKPHSDRKTLGDLYPAGQVPDVVILLDVIEHVPRQRHVALLDDLRAHFSEAPVRFFVCVPNSAYLPVRLSFLLTGALNYGHRGLFDDTHAFLFTKKSLKELTDECGYDILMWHQTPAPFELALGKNRLASVLTQLNAVAARLAPSLFTYEHMIELRPRFTLDALIRRSFENSKKDTQDD